MIIKINMFLLTSVMLCVDLVLTAMGFALKSIDIMVVVGATSIFQLVAILFVTWLVGGISAKNQVKASNTSAPHV